METNLFVYGTLQDKAIQKALFGHTITGTATSLHDYRKAKLTDPEEAGTEYPMIFPWQGARVDGALYRIPEAYLEETDEYEGPFYQRSRLQLTNGKTAWVYHSHPEVTIRFLPVGDSYTKGEDVDPEHNWPSLLIKHVQDEGIPCTLVANHAVTGHTTSEIYQQQGALPEHYQPDIVAIQGGVNDWVQGVSDEDFRHNLNVLINKVKAASPSPEIFLLNIPDFSYSPEGPQYACGRDITAGIHAFNKIIDALARKHELPVVDIFSLSKDLTEKDFFADDGLHPSGKAYQYWEEQIFEKVWPVFKGLHEGM